jgi:hypothetical protein
MSADLQADARTASEPQVRSGELVVPLGKRAARRQAKLKAAEALQNLIMDGIFEETAKPLIWSFIDKLRAQRGKRHNAALSGVERKP